MAGTTLAWIAALLGATYWLLAAAAGIATARALVRIADLPRPENGAALPSVSIVVAARDEAVTIRHDVASLVAHDHSRLELVLVDDRSSDGTGTVMDHAAAAHQNIQVVHVTALPDGWLGKVHALEQGRRAASGTWLLFTDADVELAPELPVRAVAFAEHRELDALALLPEVHSDGVFVAGAVATFSRWLVIGARMWRAADPDRIDAFGVGACNLVRASVLDAAGGFEWLRMDIADDAALAQLVASTGGRTILASGRGLVRVRWQDSVCGMTRGFEKYGGAGGAGSIRAAIALASVATIGELAPWAALGFGLVTGDWYVASIGAATIIGSILLTLMLSIRLGGSALGAATIPVSALLVWWMQMRSAWLEHRRGGVIWRGTFYPTDALREGKRYHLGARSRGRGAARRIERAHGES